MRSATRNLFPVLIAAMTLGYSLAQEGTPTVVNATATGHRFQLSTDEVPTGWTTFRFDNQGDEVHFMVIELLPDGKTIEDTINEVLPPFQEAMNLINAGDPEGGFAKLGDLPSWFGDVTFMGGPGLVSPGRVTEVTVNLPPGTYVLECYVKDEDGEFHSYHGMLEQLVVSEEASGSSEPVADVDVRISTAGIESPDELRAGRQVIAVHFDGHPAPPAFGNDLHLVRVENGLRVDEVAAWMDWSQVQGLRSPSPAEFLGGTHEMPVGSTAYVVFDLEPGDYAFLSEQAPSFEMWKEFTVSGTD